LTIGGGSLTANDTDPSGLPITITGASSPTHGSVSFNAANDSVTFTPDANYSGAASFIYSVTDANGGVSSATASMIVNDPSETSLFDPSMAPSVASTTDPHAVELGFKFTTSSAGEVTGLRFYKGDENTGAHVADLWSSTGTLLASADFTGETPSGWQQVNFASPVQVTAGATYVASYHTDGDYAADPNFFSTAHSNGALTAPSSSSSGGNGVFAYGGSSLFPTDSFNATSYGVDVLFRPQLAS
jgi:hypothetical protein